MRNKKWLSFLLCILLLSPFAFASPSGSLSEQIKMEVQQLEELKMNYEKAEKQLEEYEQNLLTVEESLQTATKDLQALSKDYELSQKKLKIWKISLTVAVPVSIIAGIFVGVCINDK